MMVIDNLASKIWYETTLNYCMMVERYPNLKEEVSGSIFDCKISSLLDINTCEVVNCLMCFGVGLLAFYLKKEKDNLAGDQYN